MDNILPDEEDNIYKIINETNRKKRSINRNTIETKLEKYKLENRVEYINDGTLLFDNLYYYYIQKKKYRKKGTQIYHKLNFDNFFKTILKDNDNG